MKPIVFFGSAFIAGVALAALAVSLIDWSVDTKPEFCGRSSTAPCGQTYVDYLKVQVHATREKSKQLW